MEGELVLLKKRSGGLVRTLKFEGVSSVLQPATLSVCVPQHIRTKLLLGTAGCGTNQTDCSSGAIRMRPSVLDGKVHLLMHLQAVHDIKRICHPGARDFFHSW